MAGGRARRPLAWNWSLDYVCAHLEVATLERDLGPRQAAGQLQQRPAPAEGALFQRVHWRFWMPKDWPALPPVSYR